MFRSAVEREFITIGEALKVLAVREPQLFAAIPEGRQIIDFRNLLTHELVLPRFNGQVVKPPAYTTIDTMNRQRRRFTTEQKAEAVGLCLSENLSILEASKRLGVHASCLGRWVKQAQIDQGGLKDSGPLTSDERIEFARLRKENRELRREKDFFRLAAAHFAKEQLSQRGFQ